MKNFKLVFSTLVVLLCLTAFSTKSVAQETYVYQYTDTKTFVTMQMKIQYSGYQVSVWYKQTSAQQPNGQWGKRDVAYHDDSIIKYTIPGAAAGKNTVVIEYDAYNHEAIYVTSTDGTRNRYFLAQ